MQPQDWKQPESTNIILDFPIETKLEERHFEKQIFFFFILAMALGMATNPMEHRTCPHRELVEPVEEYVVPGGGGRQAIHRPLQKC